MSDYDNADIRKKMWDGFKPVLVFFGWPALTITLGYLFDRTMPPGFGNAILGCQVVGAFVSAAFLAMGVPSALDPTTLVVKSGSRGSPNYFSTMERPKALKLVYAGLAVFVACNAGGYALDRAMGAPSRHTRDARRAVEQWVKYSPPAAFRDCLSRVYGGATCIVWFDARVDGNAIAVSPTSTACHQPAIARCMQTELHGAVPINKAEVLETLRYGWGSTELELRDLVILGTGPAPPAERE